MSFLVFAAAVPGRWHIRRGEKVKATCCTSNFQTRSVYIPGSEAPCLWLEIQTSTTGCRGPYQSLQTSARQLRLFSDCSHLIVGYSRPEKRLTEIWEILMQPLRAPYRHQWGLQSTLDDPLGVVLEGEGVLQPSAAWDRILTIILSSSILPLMTW